MKIYVTDLAGTTHALEALEGWQVMEIIRDYGLPIKAECGGCCCCATCHVIVHPDWVERLHAASLDEEDMIVDLPDRADTSRLSCQIVMSEALDGLQVTLTASAQP